MSALAWLFGLGTLAVVFPLVFHLIRRTPQGQQEFSSLMFLRPSPPRLTRRSRLENLLLLSLRMGAIALIAAAFMRPFFRQNVDLGLDDAAGRKLAVLLDTSASMRRGDLWEQAIARVTAIAKAADARDAVAIYTFDADLSCHIPFGLKSKNGARVSYRLDELQPTWKRSNVGKALAQLADELDQQSDKASDPAKIQIVLVSDMQAGSSTETLQGFGWPANVRVDVDRIVPKKMLTNATLMLLGADETDPGAMRDLVIVRNSMDSTNDQFSVNWARDDSEESLVGESEHGVPFYVPPGASKILKVARGDGNDKAERLVLSGDDTDFDNQFYVVPPNQQQINVAYLGNEEPDDPDQMLYYFERALFETPVRKVIVEQYVADAPFGSNDSDKPDLLVITRPVEPAEVEAVKAYLANDGTVLIVLSEIEQLESTADWTLVESDSSMTPKRSSNYAMLGSIDFEHSIFRPFAAPRLNDFTQIRFWRHLRARFKVQPDVIARFDDDSPAIWQTLRKEGEGQVVVFATGWQPSHSQLALSSKFLPIINRVIEFSATAPQVVDSMVIGQPLKLPAAYLNATVRCESRSFRRDPDRSVSDQFDRPGVYHFTVNDGPSDMEDVSIAVNLDPAESQTEPMPLEQLTAYGVQVGKHLDAASEVEQKRQLRDKELEDKQRLWKWLIVGAIALILGETWLAGRTDRANRAQDIIES